MTELRKQINNIVEDHQACLVLANSIKTSEVYEGTTATAEDILEGKTAYSSGERIVGTHKPNVTMNIPALVGQQTQLIPYKAIEVLDLSKEDLSSFTSCMNSFYGWTTLKKVTMPENTSYITSVQQMFMGCTALEEFNYFDISNVTTEDGIRNMLIDGGGKLTDETLNTLLLMLSETRIPDKSKAFRRVAGYTYPQARLQTLSNYQKFIDAGWSYEYK